jgi:hypothetical protein
MTAFIDFMMYIVVHNGNQCQSQYTMESVYGAGTFSNFSTFLTQFRPNDRTFISSEKILLSKKSDINLLIVGQEISKIVRLCSSVKCHADPKLLGSLVSSSATPPSHTTPASLAGQPPVAAAQGGPSQSGCLIM